MLHHWPAYNILVLLLISRSCYHQNYHYLGVYYYVLGHSGIAACAVPCYWRVAGSNLPQATVWCPGQVAHSKLSLIKATGYHLTHLIPGWYKKPMDQLLDREHIIIRLLVIA